MLLDYGPSDLGMLPVLDAEQLVGVFRDVDAIVRQQLEIAMIKINEQKAALVAATVSVAAKLAELS